MRGWKPPAVHASPTTAGGRGSQGAARLSRAVGLALAAAALAWLAGAFGSGQAAWRPRLIFWMASMGCGTLLGFGASALIARLGWDLAPFWRVFAVQTLAVSLPLTFIVWALAGVLLLRHAVLKALADYALPVVAVSAVMTFLMLRLDRTPLETHAPAPQAQGESSASSPVRFLARLPLRLRGAELHAVEAQDHYLRLHTSRGSDLILLRLSDAMAELDGTEGAQTHRSWWVAKAAVEGARRNEGRATLILPGGVEAPVSRSYVKALRDAGWF